MFINGDPKRSYSRKCFWSVWKKTWVWHYSAELKNCHFYCFDLLELIKLIALDDDIPSSSSWAVGKSGQSKQAIKQTSKILTLWRPLPSGQRSWKKINHVFYAKLSIKIIFARGGPWRHPSIGDRVKPPVLKFKKKPQLGFKEPLKECAHPSG